jgi:hypothetical protein
MTTIRRICGLTIMLTICGCIFHMGICTVKEPIILDGYRIMPPLGYWYHPKKLEGNFRDRDKYYLVSFFKNRNDMAKQPGEFPEDYFINFSIMPNTYSDYDFYYAKARDNGVVYSELPDEMKTKPMQGWSCKYVWHGIQGVECISARNGDLISVVGFGKNMDDINRNWPILREMLGSLKDSR